MKVAIVGCGDIAGRYGETLTPHEEIEILGATDLLADRAADWTEKYGGKVYASLDDVLSDDRVDCVVNLTIHQAHKDVIQRSIDAGKHVFSEKPLTIEPLDAFDLVERAEAKGVRLGCAPVGFLGEAQQTAWKLIRDGELGRVRLAYAEVNWGRPELWHGNPKPFYEVGPVFDVGVYPLTILTTIFGPAQRVSAHGIVLLDERTTLEGETFSPSAPDFAVALVEWPNGPIARVTANFYVTYTSRQQGTIEFHGDEGSLYLGSWFVFDAKVEYAKYGDRYAPVDLVREPYNGTEWSRGVVDMAQAIEQERPHRVTGRQAAHVVEIMSAIHTSAAEGRTVELTSGFTPPDPMEWAT